MNRLLAFGSASQVSTVTEVAQQKHQYCERVPLQLQAQHRIFFPRGYEARYAYPLFIWLHSDDSSEFELDEVMQSLSQRNYIGVGLRGPAASKSNSRKFCWSMKSADLSSSQDAVLETVRLACEDLNVNSDRIFLGGYGTGGSVAQWVGLKNPQAFAGCFSVNGAVPNLPNLLTRWKEAQQLPVRFMFGQHSQHCTSHDVEEALAFSHRCALPYEFVQFNAQDELNTAMTNRMNQQMMEVVMALPGRP